MPLKVKNNLGQDYLEQLITYINSLFSPLLDVCKDARVGKILIQTNTVTGNILLQTMYNSKHCNHDFNLCNV